MEVLRNVYGLFESCRVCDPVLLFHLIHLADHRVILEGPLECPPIVRYEHRGTVLLILEPATRVSRAICILESTLYILAL